MECTKNAMQVLLKDIKLIEKKDGDSFKTEDPFPCWT